MYTIRLILAMSIITSGKGRELRRAIPIYTVDETGRVSEILSSYNKLGENSLSEKNLSDIKTTLNNYKTDYDGSDFTYVYDLKSDLNVTVLQSINENVVANLEFYCREYRKPEPFPDSNS